MPVRGVLFDLGDTLIEEQVDDKVPLDRMRLHAKPGAEEVLRGLAGRFQLALVTDTESSPEGAVWRALANLGLAQFFDAVVTSQDMGASKPDPALFREALRRIGVPPDQAVMVGNDVDRDIAGAMRIGLRAILVIDSSYYDPERSTTAVIARTLAEVPDLVMRLHTADDRRECEA